MRYALACLLAAGCWTSSKPAEEPKPAPKPVVRDIVQPMKIEKREPVAVEDDGDPCGGVVGGVPGGVVGGTVLGGTAPPPPPPPPPGAYPQNVAPSLLEGGRIAGDKNIAPNDVTKVAIARTGKEQLIASFKLCVSDAGDVSSVTMLKSSGFTDYDNKIMTEMRTNWRYRPYLINGKAAAVCTAVTFIYRQPLAPPPPPKP